MIDAHAEEFHGRPVRDYRPGDAIDSSLAYRLSIDYEEGEAGITMPQRLAAFLDTPGSAACPALVIGAWQQVGMGTAGAPEIVEALAVARDRLPKLTGLFFGDITVEESEISWIEQTDVSPLLKAYSQLKCLRVRGGTGLSLGNLSHDRLTTLVVETGGMDRSIVQQVSDAKLPALEHLELWLGTDGYGWSGSIDDVRALLRSPVTAHLRYLGLRDSEIADAVAAAVVDSGIVERLDTLDLSLGTLGDEGAQALLASPAVARLQRLDLHHHYISKDVANALQSQLGDRVDLEGAQTEDKYGRFVAVGE